MKPQIINLDKYKVAAARREELKYFEPLCVGRRQEGRRTSRDQAGGQETQQRNRSSNVRGDSSVRSIEDVVSENEGIQSLRRRQQSSHMTHVNVHNAYFYAQAKPNTYVEVPDEDQLEVR